MRAWLACGAVVPPRPPCRAPAAARRRPARAALVLLALASGCAQVKGLQDQLSYNDGLYQLTTRWRSSARAGCAWKRHAAEFCGQPYLRDFGAGFRQGYVDVANGEDGCPPPLPPRDYWASGCDTGEGQCRSEAWYAGYPCGVQAAEQDAAGVFRPIRPSTQIRQAYVWQHARPAPAGGPALEVVPAGPAEPIRPEVPAAPAPSAPKSSPSRPGESPGGRTVAADPPRRGGEADEVSLTEFGSAPPTWTPAPLYRR